MLHDIPHFVLSFMYICRLLYIIKIKYIPHKYFIDRKHNNIFPHKKTWTKNQEMYFFLNNFSHGLTKFFFLKYIPKFFIYIFLWKTYYICVKYIMFTGIYILLNIDEKYNRNKLFPKIIKMYEIFKNTKQKNAIFYCKKRAIF